MNKNAIQKYAVWTRNELITQIKQRTYLYGIDEKGYGNENADAINGRVLSSSEKTQRKAFISEIKDHGFQQAVEEVAYTWFNRFTALRFMEVNDYLPNHVRVFSDASGGFSPEILKDVLHLDLDGLDKAKVSQLLNANATDELYRYLLITQCNAMNTSLPEMFEKLGSYTEMLLPGNILKAEGVIGRLVNDIPEEDWRDGVQIIGWLYQYYNTEPKQAVFDGLKNNVKITKDKIPAATQLFTPDWIVRYMVENSLGRLWLESNPNATLKANWKYYLDEAEQTPEVAEQLRILRSQSPVKSPEDIRLIDPCMGSGHILVYAFDVLMQIYESVGVSPRDAAKLILEKNIFGLDIDRRAYQLAYFALMMKARQYNRRILSLGVRPQVYEPTGYADGMEYGSLVCVDKLEPMPVPPKEQQMTLFDDSFETKLNVWNFRRLLAQKYDVVVTNPPYMGSNGMGIKLSDFVKKYYPDSKSDLFAVFIEKSGELMKPTGYQAMITQHAWMFLSSFEKLRGKLVHRDIVNMAHLGARAFEEIGGEVVQTTAFVMSKRSTAEFEATYVRLVDYNNQLTKEEAFLTGSDCYTAKKESFKKIPGCPIAYWASEQFIKCYENDLIDKHSFSDGQILTGNNDKYLRLLWEVCADKISKDSDWVLHAKGGEFRRWSGNIDTVVCWSESARRHYRQDRISRFPKEEILFRNGITWTLVSSNPNFGVRKLDSNLTFNKAAATILFDDESKIGYIIGFLNSKVAQMFLRVINPTLNNNIKDVLNMPIKFDETHKADVEQLVNENIELSRADWDSFEVSYGFKKHPLI